MIRIQSIADYRVHGIRDDYIHTDIPENSCKLACVRLQLLQKDELWSWGKLEKSGEEGW